MKLNTLTAISAIDGRYFEKTAQLSLIFSEFALIKYRVLIEIRYLQALAQNKYIIEVPAFSNAANNLLNSIIQNFSLEDAKSIKSIEVKINHDVKAVEYFLKHRVVKNSELVSVSEFFHFACTSEDINNLCYALMLLDCRRLIIKQMQKLLTVISNFAKKNATIPMLARTHGQAASPTTVGKEMINFVKRLKRQINSLEKVAIMGKFSGAVGNFNAHVVAYPDINWQTFAKDFVESFAINYAAYTTQIEPHDYIAEYLHAINRFNIILLDFCRDMWGYIALGYFQQKVIKDEVGSSTMPHKVNPIDFENAEGNLGIANAFNTHLADKLPVSRWQRDLSDSTVLRNIGVGFAHSLIAYKSIIKGVSKLSINDTVLLKDLINSWNVLAEPLQTVMRRYGIKNPYEKLKKFTRGQAIKQEAFIQFIQDLAVPSEVKKQLIELTPMNYIGYADKLAKDR